jgi:hypothetical protein
LSACRSPRLIRPSTTRVCSITMSQVPELCQRKPKASDEATKFAAQAFDMYVCICVCMYACIYICLSLYTCLREPWCFMSKCEAATVSPCTKTVSERSANHMQSLNGTLFTRLWHALVKTWPAPRRRHASSPQNSCLRTAVVTELTPVRVL